MDDVEVVGFDGADEFDRMSDAIRWVEGLRGYGPRKRIHQHTPAGTLVWVRLTSAERDPEITDGYYMPAKLMYPDTDALTGALFWQELLEDAAGSGSGSGYVEASGSGSGTQPSMVRVRNTTIADSLIEFDATKVFAGVVSHTGPEGYGRIILLGGASGGSRVEVVEEYNSGVTPPVGYLDARVRIWNPESNTLEVGDAIWLKDVT